MPIDYSPMKNLSVGIKFMLKGIDDFKYLLVAACEITNFLWAIPSKPKE